MKTAAGWVLGRLSEPSTFAGLALMATAVQNAIANHDWQSIAATGFGALAVLFREARA